MELPGQSLAFFFSIAVSELWHFCFVLFCWLSLLSFAAAAPSDASWVSDVKASHRWGRGNVELLCTSVPASAWDFPGVCLVAN